MSGTSSHAHRVGRGAFVDGADRFGDIGHQEEAEAVELTKLKIFLKMESGS